MAVALARLRGVARGDADARRRARRVGWLAIAAQAAHFTEELVAGFATWFPGRLGLAPWPTAFFVALNLGWLAIWILATFASGRARTAADVALWFLALALIANGVAHPLLALGAGGYVPGLLTSPFAGIAGVLLWRARQAVTAPREAARGDS